LYTLAVIYTRECGYRNAFGLHLHQPTDWLRRPDFCTSEVMAANVSSDL